MWYNRPRQPKGGRGLCSETSVVVTDRHPADPQILWGCCNPDSLGESPWLGGRSTSYCRYLPCLPPPSPSLTQVNCMGTAVRTPPRPIWKTVSKRTECCELCIAYSSSWNKAGELTRRCWVQVTSEVTYCKAGFPVVKLIRLFFNSWKTTKPTKLTKLGLYEMELCLLFRGGSWNLSVAWWRKVTGGFVFWALGTTFLCGHFV